MEAAKSNSRLLLTLRIKENHRMVFSGWVMQANLGFEKMILAAIRTFQLNLKRSFLMACLTLGK